MSSHPIQQALAAGLAQLKLDRPELRAQLLVFLDELARWNSAYNLTAIRDLDEMVVRHVLDSLVVLPYMNGRVLDVGAGAGLPAIPLALANPALQMTMLDSNGKKARFMRHAIRTLKIEGAQVVEGRVEDHAGSYDTITSRAFASLADFYDKTSHLLASGGVWVAMKGKLDAKELAEIPADVEIRETVRLLVPGLNEERHAVIALKKTP